MWSVSRDVRKSNHFLAQLNLYSAAICCLAAQSCLTLYDPMNHSPPGSSVLGISQARILERVTISFSRILLYVNYISIKLEEKK